MRYNPVLHKKSRASRRGIAVMFALGILSLVIVAVLVFSQRAVTDRKVASAYSRYSESKDLAQSAFERAQLQFKKNAASGSAFFSDAGNDDVDWLWKLDPERRILPSGAPVRWQYVYDSEGHIIGRYAYIIIGEKRLNLNAILDHSTCGAPCDGMTGAGCPRLKRRGNTAAELRFDPSAFSSIFTFDGDKFNAEKLQAVIESGAVKQYASLEELYPACTPQTGWTEADVRNRIDALLNISLSEAVKDPDAWFGGDANSNGAKDKAEFYQRFRLRRTDWSTVTVNDILKTAETFYSGDTPKGANTAGIPWLKNWSDTEGNWPDAATKSKQIAANLINYCAPETRAVVSDVTPSSWSFTEVPTFTGNKRTWYLNECYVKLTVTATRGTRKSHAIKNDNGETTGYWYSFGDDGSSGIKIRLTISPELINMYTDTLSGTYSVKVLAQVRLKYDRWGYSNLGNSFTLEPQDPNEYSTDYPRAGFSCSTPIFSITQTGYKRFNLTEEDGGGGLFGSSYVEDSVGIGRYASNDKNPVLSDFFKIRDVSVKLKLIATRNGSENVDFASLPAISAANDLSFNASETTVVEKSFSADDPRHNLHAADWTEQEETLGSRNNGLTCTGGAFADGSGWTRDPETATNPANKTISTAYIRHAPMESLWELGAIHRAAPWQTLNFKRPKYTLVSDEDRLKEDLTTKGGGAYGDGDFRILDQVTMQGGTYKPVALFGKVNLNAPGTATRRFVFDSLFRGMQWSTSGYDLTADTPSSGDETDSTARVLANKLGTAPNLVKLYRRTDIYKVRHDAAFWDLIEKSPDGSTDLTTDAQQEQLIGRTIGLTTADTTPDSATVIVLAQSIKDMGGGAVVYPDWDSNGSTEGAILTNAGKLKTGYYSYSESSDNVSDPNLFSSSLRKNYSNDPITTQFGQYDNGADRITGETRLVGRLLYDRAQGKWKIVQVQNED